MPFALSSRMIMLMSVSAMLLPLSLNAQQPGWEQQLRQQIPVASIGNNGLVVRPGTLATVIKDGITALPVAPQVSPGMAWPNTYKKGGRVGTSALQRLNYGPVQEFSRVLQVGEVAYIYQIQVKSNEIVLSLQTAPSNPAEGLYRANLSFQFPKGEMETADLNAVDAFLSEVLQIDMPAAAQSSGYQPASARSSAGATAAPTPGMGLLPHPAPVKLALPSHFVNTQSASNQLDLKGDGTLSLLEDGQTYKGTFVQTGNSLELNISDANTKTTVTIEGSKLVDASGQTWVLQPGTK